MTNINIEKITLVREPEPKYNATVEDVEDAYEIAKKIGITDAAEEYLYLICLDAGGSISGVHEVSHGSIAYAPVHPREVFKRALLNNAYGIILMHNHPSGNSTPSQDDVVLTQRMIEAGGILGVKVFDHLVVTQDGYTSIVKELNEENI
jgi:DNA repair protein RadC